MVHRSTDLPCMGEVICYLNRCLGEGELRQEETGELDPGKGEETPPAAQPWRLHPYRTDFFWLAPRRWKPEASMSTARLRRQSVRHSRSADESVCPATRSPYTRCEDRLIERSPEKSTRRCRQPPLLPRSNYALGLLHSADCATRPRTTE
jgi:hypothetical protein